MSPLLALLLVCVLTAASYAAGRLHGQLSYRIGYRFGYRQGYFDGDRGAWNRRRRDAQAAIASALAGPRPVEAARTRIAPPMARSGTTYTGTAAAPAGGRQGTGAATAPVDGRHSTGTLVRRSG
ncbi:hypothetical protein [Salinispora pacifica]|uniref:hypothetical protein n=1 Tax=Salinispora pacifica TaxID=351187 RepID=UPI00048923A6|nr:hypothetical protein [Salinispora pacifica]